MKINHLIVIGSVAVSAFIYTSCVENDVIIDTDVLTKWDRPLNIDMPLAKAYFSSQDLIERIGDSLQQYIEISDEGLLCIKYKDTILTLWDEIVQFEEVTFSKEYSASGLKKSTNTTISYTDKIKLNEDSMQRFDSMYIEEATLSLNLDFPQNYTGTVTITFPELQKDVVPLSYSYDIAADNNPSEEENLNGYFVEFKHGQDSSYITLLVDLDITPNGNGQSTSNDAIGVTINMPSLTPTILFGYFGNKTVVDRNETMTFHFFEDMEMDQIVEFYDIQMIVEFYNYFGMPFNGIMEDAQLVREDFSGDLEVDFKGNNTFYVDEAEYSETIQPTFFSKTFSDSNSNIREAVNFYPDELDYHLIVDINPNDDTSIQNFVTQNNYIAGNTYVIIPLWFRTAAYNRVDTISFKINSLLGEDRIDYIESVELTFNFENGFPFELDAQAFPVDPYGVIVDSLFEEDQQLITSGILNDEDIVTSTSESSVTIHLNQDQLIKYRDADVENILLATRTITSNNGDVFVKLLDTYGISFKLTMSVTSDEITK